MEYNIYTEKQKAKSKPKNKINQLDWQTGRS